FLVLKKFKQLQFFSKVMLYPGVQLKEKQKTKPRQVQNVCLSD
ncbi:hypothetical protein H8958_022846, partial [Nasalis larvatus]